MMSKNSKRNQIINKHYIGNNKLSTALYISVIIICGFITSYSISPSAYATDRSYIITYDDSLISNMPTDESSFSAAQSVNISSTVPTRTGFIFAGWCTALPTASGNNLNNCSGTTYATGAPWSLGATNNNLTLYAMWEGTESVIANTTCSTPVPGITYMQELSDSTKKTTALSNMTEGVQYVLVDERDNNGYCVAKQADGNIWMTQNLDLDINGTNTATLTANNTDLNTSGTAPYNTAGGYSTSNGVITWIPSTSATTADRTIAGSSSVVPSMPTDSTAPYSVEGSDRYYYTTGDTSDETRQTLTECKANHTEEECAHYHVGNYYNWTAAIASNDSSGIGATNYDVAANSICPKGWKLPQGRTSIADAAATRQFGNLWYTSGITSSVSATSYANDGFINIRISPLFFVRGGYISNSLYSAGNSGWYWSSSVYRTSYSSTDYAYGVRFDSSIIESADYRSRGNGQFVRCLVR